MKQAGPQRAAMKQVRYSLGAEATFAFTKFVLVLCIKGSPSRVSKQPTHLVRFQEREGTQLKSVECNTGAMGGDQSL